MTDRIYDTQNTTPSQPQPDTGDATMNLGYLPTDKLIRIVQQQDAGAYRVDSPFWKAANLARRVLLKRGYIVDDPADETQEYPAVSPEAYDD